MLVLGGKYRQVTYLSKVVRDIVIKSLSEHVEKFEESTDLGYLLSAFLLRPHRLPCPECPTSGVAVLY